MDHVRSHDEAVKQYDHQQCLEHPRNICRIAGFMSPKGGSLLQLPVPYGTNTQVIVFFKKKNMRLHFVHNKPEVWKSLANETSSKGREKGWSCHAYVRCLPMFTMSHDEAIYIPIHNLPILEDLKDIVRPYETQSLSTEISRDELNVGHSSGYGANPGPPVPGE